MDNVHFDITAKYPPGTKFKDFAQPMLLRTRCAEDNFGLVVHRETKEMPGYTLLVDKGGFKLKAADPGEEVTTESNEGNVWTLNARKTGMSTLAWELADGLGEVVVDKTGLNGVYDFRLRCVANDASGAPASDANPPPSIFTALQETLGLRLQHGKVPVEMIVVDHSDRMPFEN